MDNILKIEHLSLTITKPITAIRSHAWATVSTVLCI